MLGYFVNSIVLDFTQSNNTYIEYIAIQGLKSITDLWRQRLINNDTEEVHKHSSTQLMRLGWGGWQR